MSVGAYDGAAVWDEFGRSLQFGRIVEGRRILAWASWCARRIIEQILSDPKVRESRRFVDGRFASRVYEDEPILKTGADLVAPACRARGKL